MGILRFHRLLTTTAGYRSKQTVQHLFLARSGVSQVSRPW